MRTELYSIKSYFLPLKNKSKKNLFNFYPTAPLTALMPLNCWLNCITIPIMSGARNVGEQINSIIEMLLSDCCARSSARISSMSSSTWFEALNRLSAESGSRFCSIRKNCCHAMREKKRKWKNIVQILWQKIDVKSFCTQLFSTMTFLWNIQKAFETEFLMLV